jgi:hypothetical protein
LPHQLTKEQIFQSAISINQYLIQHYFVPGKVENWVVVNDLGGVSVFKIPFSILKELGSMLEKNYRTRLFRLYLVNAPWTMKLLFDMFKSFDKNIQKKIYVNSKNVADQIFQHAHPEQLEVKFGGTKPNIFGEFFPPRG